MAVSGRGVGEGRGVRTLKKSQWELWSGVSAVKFTVHVPNLWFHEPHSLLNQRYESHQDWGELLVHRCTPWAWPGSSLSYLNVQAGLCIYPGAPTLSPTHSPSTCPGLPTPLQVPRGVDHVGIGECGQWVLHLQKKKPQGHLGSSWDRVEQGACACASECIYLFLATPGIFESPHHLPAGQLQGWIQVLWNLKFTQLGFL